MKFLSALRLLFLSSLIIFYCHFAFSQTGTLTAPDQGSKFKVHFGERPPIDLNAMPKTAYEAGKIKIKLQASAETLIPADGLTQTQQGFVITGHPELDRLNRQFGVKRYTPLFEALYATGSRSIEFKERHRAWELHLWFELEIDRDADVIAAVKSFSALRDVNVAEPEYKKQQVISSLAPELQEPVKYEGDPESTRWAPNDPRYNEQWHYNNTGQQGGTPGKDISLEDAWEMEKGSSNVIVAIVDGGIDYNHSDLSGNMWSGIGYNFVTGSSSVSPENHGTHVAGTVAAVTNNSVGVAGVAGGSGAGNGVRLMSCQVFDGDENDGFHLAPVYAADNGAAISQNSWGYTAAGAYDQAVLDAIDYFNANGGGGAMDGGITIFAAGNDNTTGAWYPGYYSGCFSIAATNNQDVKSWYSTYDTWVDISAPGGETNSVNARGVLSTLPNNTYGFYQGTSMACPHASGVAALMISYAYGELTPADVADILRTTTDDHYDVNPGYIGMLGTGRLNAHAALLEVQGMISGVRNPQNFAGTGVSTNQINLTWAKNQDNNNVMVVWSEENTFGTPAAGTVYSQGQALPGGGTVLYRGGLTGTSHTGLDPSTRYYYRAFSYNAANEYSSGVSTNAATLCGIFAGLPFSEDFNAAPTLPLCWEIADNQGNGQVWQVGTFSGGINGTTGNYAYLNSDGYGSGNSQNSDLITPTLDLSGLGSITLSFNHYFRSYSGSSGYVAYSINDGATWTTIQTWTATTSNPASFSQEIPALANHSAVKIKWNYTGTWGYYWSIDNIEITGVTLAPNANFYTDNTMPMVGETVTFYDNSGGGTFSDWQWDFGAGAQPATATSQGPHQVSYNTTGNKTVSLLVDGIYQEIKEDYITVTDLMYSEEATYTAGNISTDFGFDSPSESSSCPGILTVSVPTNAIITSVDVAYSMTTANNGWTSEQRSQLRCVSPGGSDESQVYSGTGDSGGTQSYTRSGLNIANNVSGGGNIQFELHAGRTWGGSGCNTTYNRVNNNSWTVTVHYFLEQEYEADFEANPTEICLGGQIQFSDLSSGNPTAWLWSFPGGTPATSSLQNPVITYQDAGTFDVSLTAWYPDGEATITKNALITVNSLPLTPSPIIGNQAVCASTIEQYDVNPIPFTDEYKWELTPENAGTITSGEASCLIEWNPNFQGEATLKVRGINNCGPGDWSPNLAITVANCYVGQLPPGWDFFNTGATDEIIIPADAVINTFESQLAEGSFLGVFYVDDANNEQCGGAVQFVPGVDLYLTTFGNNPATPQKDGFDQGETYNWKIFNALNQKEYEGAVVYRENTLSSGSFGNGINEVETLDALANFIIAPIEGWSGFSLPFVPLNSEITEIFQEMNNELIILQNASYIYWPEANLNNFPSWQATFGAQLKMSSGGATTLTGTPGGNTVGLPAGWSYLPVMSLCEVSLTELIQNDPDNVEVIKTIAGNSVYWPEMGIYNLMILEPGKAYMIKLKQPATLNFPDCMN